MCQICIRWCSESMIYAKDVSGNTDEDFVTDSVKTHLDYIKK
jgi:hypothetical protein